MSATGTQLLLREARTMALDIIAAIRGEAYVVGSIRRKKPEVGDIEILVHRDAKIDIDVGVGPLLPAAYETIKGGPRKKDDWKHWQLRHVASRVHVDLFRFDDDNRGSMMLIRTGPREFSQWFVESLHSYGYCHVEGYVRDLDDDIRIVPCGDEHYAFRLARMTYIEPEKRR